MDGKQRKSSKQEAGECQDFRQITVMLCGAMPSKFFVQKCIIAKVQGCKSKRLQRCCLEALYCRCCPGKGHRYGHCSICLNDPYRQGIWLASMCIGAYVVSKGPDMVSKPQFVPVPPKALLFSYPRMAWLGRTESPVTARSLS